LLHPTRSHTHHVLLTLILTAFYSLSSMPLALSLTSYSSLYIVQLSSISVTLRAALTMLQSSPSYLPSFLLHLTCHPTLHVLLAIVLATVVFITILLIIVLIAWCSSHRAPCVVCIVSCHIRQLFFVSNMQSNATHIKTALLLDCGDGHDTGCLYWEGEVW
jgi:hypothetical protein